MRSGSRGDHVHAGVRASRYRHAGFTYLMLLAALAIAGTGVAAVGERWTAAAQRERERELIFRGEQIRTAIERYRDALPEAQALPTSLDELLVDRRSTPPRHHLRRAYPDPFTQQLDWVLLRDGQGGLLGVHSSAPVRARGRGPKGALATGQRVSDWRFVAHAGTAAPTDAAQQYRGGTAFTPTPDKETE